MRWIGIIKNIARHIYTLLAHVFFSLTVSSILINIENYISTRILDAPESGIVIPLVTIALSFVFSVRHYHPSDG